MSTKNGGFDFNSDEGVTNGVGGGVTNVTASAPLSLFGLKVDKED